MTTRNIFIPLLLCSLFALFDASPASAAPPLTIDGFRIYSSGTVNITNNGTDGRIKAVAVQPWDGKIIIGGTFTAKAGTEVRKNLARLKFDGTLDTTFTTTVDGPVNALLLQPDPDNPLTPDKSLLLIGGSFGQIGTEARNGIARLKPDGQVDGSFDPDLSAGTKAVPVVNALALDTGGSRIIVGGDFTPFGGGSNIAAVDYLGIVENSFSGGVDGAVYALALQSDRKVVVGGAFLSPRSHLIRFLSTGGIDPNLKVSPLAAVRALAVQVDWSILVGGDFSEITVGEGPSATTSARPHLARIHRDGYLDDFNPSPDNAVSSILVQPDGMIVVGGAFSNILLPAREALGGGKYQQAGLPAVRNRAARFHIDGRLDSAMDPDAGGDGDVSVEALAQQPDEKVIMGGKFTTASGKPRTMLARFYFGTLDDDAPAIGPRLQNEAPEGKYTQAYTYHLANLPDGSFIVSGVFINIFPAPPDEAYVDPYGKAGGQPYHGLSMKLGPDWRFKKFQLAAAPFSVVSPRYENDNLIIGQSIGSNWFDHATHTNYVMPDERGTVTGYQPWDTEASFENSSVGEFSPIGGLDINLPFNAHQAVVNFDHDANIFLHHQTLDVLEAPDGAIYLAGLYRTGLERPDVTTPLLKLSTDGEWDSDFSNYPSIPDEFFHCSNYVGSSSVVIDPGASKDDYKIIASSVCGQIARVDQKGLKDPSFTVYDEIGDKNHDYMVEVTGWASRLVMVLDREGQLYAGGVGAPTFKDSQRSWMRLQKLKMKHVEGEQDGIPDDNFKLLFYNNFAHARYKAIEPLQKVTSFNNILLRGDFDHWSFESITGISPLADGSMLVCGSFDEVKQGENPSVNVQDVVRILPNGELDPNFNLGTFSPDTREYYSWEQFVRYAMVQKDGKVIVGGQFTGVNGDKNKAAIFRVAGGHATQELTLSADGSKITWKRGGWSPEVKRVRFQHSSDGVTWDELGEGTRIPHTGDWEIMLPAEKNLLLKTPAGQNHYVRARGNEMQGKGTGALIESTRIYYINPKITVKAQPTAKVKGESNPTFHAAFFYNADGREMVPATMTGTPLFSAYTPGNTQVDEGTDVGDYTIRTDLNNLSSPMYTFVPGDSTLSILGAATKQPITVKAKAVTKVYGDDNPSFEAAYYKADGTPLVPYPMSGSPLFRAVTPGEATVDKNTPVGAYAIRTDVNDLSSTLYTFVGADSTLTIVKKTVYVLPLSTWKVYGDDDPPFTYTYTPALVGSDTFSGTLTRESGENAGSYPYKQIGLTLNGNYTILYSPSAFTIRKRDASVKINYPGSKVYGEPAQPTLTGTLSGFLPKDGVSATYSRKLGETASFYPIIASLAPTSALGNYNVDVQATAFQIKKKPASVTPKPASRKFGSYDDPPLTGTLSGFLAADNVSATYTRTSGGFWGTYTISVDQMTGSNLDSYDITYNTATFTISDSGKMAASVTPNPASKTFGQIGAEFETFTGTLAGFDPADNVSATYTRTPGEDVGTYTISVANVSGSNLDLYDITYKTATFTINPAPGKTASVTPNPASKTYGQTGIEFETLTGTLTGFDPADGVSAVYTRETGEKAGTYTISATLSGSNLASYAITYRTALFTIDKKDATLQADEGIVKVYGDPADPALTTSDSGFLEEDLGPGKITFSATRETGETAKSYDITPAASDNGSHLLDNYNVTPVGAKFTIIKKAAIVKADEGLSKVYGDPADPALTTTNSGFLADDLGPGKITFGATRQPGETVKTYDITPAATDNGSGLLGNYLVDPVPAKFAITRKGATVKADEGLGKVYGQPTDPALTTTNSGFLADDLGPSKITFGASRQPGETVKSYDITPAASDNGSGLLDNYTVSLLPAKFTITRKGATVKADEGLGKVYGQQPDPALTTTNSGFLTDDLGPGKITFGASRQPGESVKSYDITPAASDNGSGLLDNYTVSLVPAKFAVTRKGATVKADEGIGKVYGQQADPALTTTNSGFLADDLGPSKITFSAFRQPGETVKSYDITPAASDNGSGLLDNYTVSLVPAKFTITRKGATVKADEGIGKVYGQQPDPALSIANSGFLTDDLGSGKITFSASRQPGETVKSYDITPAATDNGSGLLDNYTVSLVPAKFTITKAPLTVKADNKSKIYLAALPELTVTYTGLVNSDTPDSLGGKPSITTTATAASLKGSYPIEVAMGGITSTNYEYTFKPGTLTITGNKLQSISFSDMTKTYGAADFDPGARASSGLDVSYESESEEIATVVEGNKLHLVAPGTSDITASQAGDNDWEAAADETRLLTVRPPPGNCVNFDGIDDVMRVADAPQLNFGGDAGFTIETWLHLDGAQPDGTGLVSKGSLAEGCGTGGYQLILQQDRVAAQLSDGNVTLGPANGLIGTTDLNDGAWHHVAFSVDRTTSTASLYVDGRLEAQLSTPALGINTDNTAPVMVGVDGSGSHFFRGDIDELRLWDAARSKNEIRGAISEIIDPADEPHLVAYYHLDEGTPGGFNPTLVTAPDRTTYGADGTLMNFALSGATSNWLLSHAFIPLLETAPLSGLTASGATGGGVFYPNYYPPTRYGVCWTKADVSGSGELCAAATRSTDGIYSVQLSALIAGETYHYRGFADNTMGRAWGNVLSLLVKLDQTITFGPLPEKTYGDAPFAAGGTSTSHLPITYTSSNPSVAEVVNGQVLIKAAGSTVITASQPGNTVYNPATAIAVTLVVVKAPLTVTADYKGRAFKTPNPALTWAISGYVNDDTLGVVSGRPLLSTSATIDSEVGDYGIAVDVTQLSAANYRFIAVDGTLKVFKSCQEIIFPALPEKTYGDPPFTINAYACSDLSIAFSSSDSRVGQVSGSQITITGAGSTIITASQQGSGNVGTAPPVSQTLIVHKSGQVVTFPALADKVLGDPPFTLSATASSGLPVSYLSSDPAVATVSGNTVTLVGAGTAVISALQEGNANYYPALPFSRPLTVSLEAVPPVLTLSTLSPGAVTAVPVLNIMGSAADSSGIAALTVNGADLTSRAGLFSCAIPLACGDNSISVVATDGAGNRTSQTLNVTLDAAAPAISVRAPADNSVTDLPLFTASGTVTPGSTVVMDVNGGSPQYLAVTDGSFTGNGYLVEGLNTIGFSAELAGRNSKAKRSVTFAPGKPAVAITVPAEDARTERGSVTVEGTASSPASGVSVVLDVDGAVSTATLENGSFRLDVPLTRAGETRISASATDAGGNTSVAYRNVVKVDKILGDLNGDGEVDLADAVAALRMSVGLQAVTPEALFHADVAPLVNGIPQPDGKIDVGDVLVILRKIVGLVNF